VAKVTVIARVVAKKEAIAAVKTELLKLIGPTRNEAGCQEYRLHQDNEDPSLFIFYENWESAACLEQHLNSAHFREYIDAVDGKIADKVVHRMTMIP